MMTDISNLKWPQNDTYCDTSMERRLHIQPCKSEPELEETPETKKEPGAEI